MNFETFGRQLHDLCPATAFSQIQTMLETGVPTTVSERGKLNLYAAQASNQMLSAWTESYLSEAFAYATPDTAEGLYTITVGDAIGGGQIDPNVAFDLLESDGCIPWEKETLAGILHRQFPDDDQMFDVICEQSPEYAQHASAVSDILAASNYETLDAAIWNMRSVMDLSKTERFSVMNEALRSGKLELPQKMLLMFETVMVADDIIEEREATDCFGVLLRRYFIAKKYRKVKMGSSNITSETKLLLNLMSLEWTPTLIRSSWFPTLHHEMQTKVIVNTENVLNSLRETVGFADENDREKVKVLLQGTLDALDEYKSAGTFNDA